MFGSIFHSLGFGITFIYPMKESYKLLSNSQNQSLLQNQSIVNSFSHWLSYWIILAILQTFISSKLISLIISLIPFNGIVMLYLKIWLVFPIISIDNGDKVSGSFILYHYYLLDFLNFLANLDQYVNSLDLAPLIKSLVRLYNQTIDTYFSGIGFANFLKIDIQQSEQQQQQQQSLMGSIGELWNETGITHLYKSLPFITSNTNKTMNDTTHAPNFIPVILLKSLLSPLASLLGRNDNNIKHVSREGSQSPTEGYDIVSKDDFRSSSSGSYLVNSELNVPKHRDQLRNKSNSSTSVPNLASGTRQSSVSSASASIWGIRSGSRSTSASGSTLKEQFNNTGN